MSLPTSAIDTIVSVSCLKHIYPDTTEIHICGLDFVVTKGERVVVLGGNGSGKTTLLYHILGLLKPDEGNVAVFGINPAEQYNAIREHIGVLLQNVDDQILSPTVWEDISFSPRNYGYGKEETSKMVEQVLKELGIQHLRDKICHYLSGGEKRKVALAGALVMRPDLLILDEPFEGLDNRSRTELVALLNTY
ncbi:MAG: energy-coupling factor ABC transporter ATP-binding protein, partial [Betaproteobacteria bacterium]